MEWCSLTPAGNLRALLSWSASMFEYFMPLLVMESYPGTLLLVTHDRRMLDAVHTNRQLVLSDGTVREL